MILIKQSVEVLGSHPVVIRKKDEPGRCPPSPCPQQDSRVAVGRLLVALVVLHVECHLAGLAVEACFMPVLGTEREGGHPSDTRTLGRGLRLHPRDWTTQSPW